MSRLQEAVDRFAAAWLAEHGEKPDQNTLSNGVFSLQTGEDFCLCYRPMAQLINFAGLTCDYCRKPVTEDGTNAWMDEARVERRLTR